MAGSGLPELYLTDIFVEVPLQAAFLGLVFPRCHTGVGFKGADEVRLIEKVTLVADFRQRQVSVVHKMHGVQVFFVEQDFFGVHAGGLEHFAGQMPG